ncbi:MAG: glutamate 5-kinase [Betaproteobacteria bacterium]|nr:glutamate 5-kinase [Betaproteobacteria bacterium]NBT74733.1 glutamate 5-kinase [Betaproteobacteria bacterium]NBY14722.1 glutamate 5-kinase [Betaproteobacteria bacterium]NCA15554.1 glutamate 5-kinase [Betaproteobacteria bacterium]
MQTSRPEIQAARRWVVKLGSSLVTNQGRGVDLEAVTAFASQVADLRAQGHQVVMVSSGAIAEGMKRLGWGRRPHEIHDLQAAAAVGQMGLAQAYDAGFSRFALQTAQILLTHEDIADRRRYLNARSTLRTLLDLGVVPIVNENDTVVTDEIKLGDNDTLAALVTNLLEADVLVILTDQAGLFSSDPRKDPSAKLIERASASHASLVQMAGGAGSMIGTGGMATKVRAARRAAASGAHTLIASGLEPKVLLRLVSGESVGSLLTADLPVWTARQQWLADHLTLRGHVSIDEGAVKVLQSGGKSLLPIGVIDVGGEFERGDVVACLASSGNEVARGLANYSSKEIRRIMGQPSSQIEAVLGFVEEPEFIHRDNLVLTSSAENSSPASSVSASE